MAGINGKCPSVRVQGCRQALSLWPLAFSNPNIKPQPSAPLRLRGENGGRA
jgi:hypothetical protein